MFHPNVSTDFSVFSAHNLFLMSVHTKPCIQKYRCWTSRICIWTWQWTIWVMWEWFLSV